MKHFLFRYYYWIALFLILLVISVKCCGILDFDWKLAVTILGGILWSVYLVQKQKLDEIHLFKELFTKFNARYSDLNEALNQILQGDDEQELTTKEIDKLYDYFNLCGEEYFFYEQGYIPSKVWKAWSNGIKIFLQNKRIRKVWKNEVRTDSYYGLSLKEFEKD